MNEEEICNYLLNDGWKEFPDVFRKESRNFAKHFETETPCFGNDRQGEIQVVISVSTWNGSSSYEIELCGEGKDGTWFKVLNYALPENIEDGIKLIPRMLAAWEVLANN